MVSSPFAEVPLAPKDPILGVTEQFISDPRPNKVNLGVGVYYDGDGKLPLLDAVRQAEDTLAAGHGARGYLPIDGIKPYNKAVQSLLFGADSHADGRRKAPDGAGPGRHRSAAYRRRSAQAIYAQHGCLHQRSELGEPPRAVRGRGLCGAAIPLL